MPKATIFVVDDEALSRWSLTERLQAEGYEMLEAETGEGALSKLPEGVGAARPFSLQRLAGESSSVKALRSLVARVAASPASTVLLTGESGTGKDLVATIIHYASDRASQLFMNITCSALPEQLLESELFGHERGAFTDARMQKKGLLEMADGGTVFLDEIGEMTPGLQSTLLRFLEEQSFKRVGGSHDIRVDVRVVAATNRNLEEEVGGPATCENSQCHRPRDASV
jgi:two-component system, NtrC family, response regulator AtoC